MYHHFEQRFGFAIPELYREMAGRGWFDWGRLNREDVIGSVYLWLPDVRWWTVEQMVAYQHPEYHLPGFVPFAGGDAGDFWCWWPERATEQGIPVVMCPHDYMMANIVAPDFRGWLYRRILAYSNGHLYPEEEAEARAWLGRWIRDLGPLFLAGWQETLERVAAAPYQTWPQPGYSYEQSGFLPTVEYKAIVERDLACPGLDERFVWMK
jgi:hypothetical protein